MQSIQDVISAVMNTLSCHVDPRVSMLKKATYNHLTTHKDMCPNIVEASLNTIDTIDAVELYVRQHHDIEDLVSIYKSMTFNDEAI